MVMEILKDKTVEAIYRNYEVTNRDWFPTRLGASIIGKKCSRELWYNFRWAHKKKFPGRILRLFETGHLEEPRMVKNLRDLNILVNDIDDNTNKQFTFTSVGGHFVCKIDGCALGILDAPKTWHVLEFKTSNNKGFVLIEKNGVESEKYEHLAQCQMGMHLSGMKRAYYLVKNKDTDALYAERIPYNKELSTQLINRATDIIYSTEPPARIGGPAYFLCKFCDYYDLCHDDLLPLFNCRTCSYSTPKPGPEWLCEKKNVALQKERQLSGCEHHLFIPPMINAKLTDYQFKECVVYTMHDESRFCNAPEYAFPKVDEKDYSFILPSEKMSGKTIGELSK